MKCIYELMLENYARCTCLFQSPRSGKFVSDEFTTFSINKNKVQTKCFNPLDRGNLYQIRSTLFGVLRNEFGLFQSPRSGKFVSDRLLEALFDAPEGTAEFQSPRSGNLYQIFSFFDYAFDDWDVVSIP